MHGLLKGAFSEWAGSLGTRLPVELGFAHVDAPGTAAALVADEPDEEAQEVGLGEVGARVPDIAHLAAVASSKEYREVV